MLTRTLHSDDEFISTESTKFLSLQSDLNDKATSKLLPNQEKCLPNSSIQKVGKKTRIFKPLKILGVKIGYAFQCIQIQ